MKRVLLALISTLFLVMTGTLATKGFFDVPALSARIPSYAGLEMTSVKEFGAIGDGQTDDTAAIQAAIDAMPDAGGVIYLPIGTYLVRPLTCTKPVRFTAPRTATNRNGVPEGSTLLAAGNQTHILMLGGENNTLANWVMGGGLENISLSGGYNTLSDALLVLQYIQFAKLTNVYISQGNCRAIRFKNVMDMGIDTLRLFGAGRDGDSVMYIDAQEAPYWTNEIRFYGKCQWENNLGSILKCSPDSYADGIFFDGVDFERSIKYDKSPVPVFDIADLNRLSISNCSFANYDDNVNTVFANLKGGNNRFYVAGGYKRE
jgi:hypothetical protein